MEILGVIIGFILLVGGLLIYASLSWGYVTYLFYAWFLLPVFHDLPHVTLVQAIGLNFFIGLFVKYNPNEKEEDDKKKKISRIIVALGMPWFTLLMGYIFKAWFM